jgi:hypothetical protein
MFLMLGFMVGAFGLMGSEMMNRRFGQASLLSYSARSLPLSEKTIFFNFVVKDTVYYFFLWVLPFGGGYIAASPFTGTPLDRAFLLLLTLALSFMSGLCVVFLLSALYVRSKRACLLTVLALAAACVGFAFATGRNPAAYFPPFLIYETFSWSMLLWTCSLLVVLFALSIVLFSPEQAGSTRTYSRALGPLIRRLSFLPYPPLAAKDLVDLYRSGIGVGQALFSFLIPLVVIWFFLSLAGSYLPAHGLLFMFALVTGIIASTMYTWVTEFDPFGPYACLPVAVSTLIRSKMSTFLLLQAAPAVFIAAVAALAGESRYILPAVVLCLSVSFYAAGVMAWLCGLSPSVLVYNVKVLATYLVLDGIALAIFATISFANPFYAFASVVLVLPGWIFVKRAMARWDAVDPAGF